MRGGKGTQNSCISGHRVSRWRLKRRPAFRPAESFCAKTHRRSTAPLCLIFLRMLGSVARKMATLLFDTLRFTVIRRRDGSIEITPKEDPTNVRIVHTL